MTLIRGGNHDHAPVMNVSRRSLRHREAQSIMNGENSTLAAPKSGEKLRSPSFFVLLGGAIFVFIETFSLLSPILLSFLLILLISLAVNPLISRMRVLTGGRKVATALVAGAVVLVMGLTCWAFFDRWRPPAQKSRPGCLFTWSVSKDRL